MMHIRAKYEADKTLCGLPTGTLAREMSYTAEQYIARAARGMRNKICKRCKDSQARTAEPQG